MAITREPIPPPASQARFGALGLAILVALAAGAAGRAEAADAGSGATADGSFWGTLWQRSTLLGDLGGLRPWLGSYGMTLGLTETSEVLGNVSGGVKRGAAYDGLTTATLGLDTQKAFGWEGGTFNVSGLYIHGRSLSADNLLNLQTASGIEADRSLRLWELWYQQAVLDGRLDVKLGQQSLDQEFMVSQYAGLFVNTMFGWPMLPSANLPSGGPAYPLSAPGIRLRAKPTDALTVLAGVFNDNPAGPGDGDPQQRNGSGTNFRISDAPLAIFEIQYATPSAGDMDYGTGAAGLPGVYKLGFWYDAGRFDDQRFDAAGLSLADPAGTGIPRRHQGDYSLYAVMDQLLWRPSAESSQGLGVFARAMGTPEDDRNLIDFSLNAGLTLKAPLPGRDNDTLGIGGGYTRVSAAAGGLDRDTGFYTGTPVPVRGSETYIEVTYQYQVNPWWQIQPDFQYVFNPGGGIANPNSASGALVDDEAVFGVRTNITF
jgi:porin